MMAERTISFELTRDKAIEMILGDNSQISLNISIDCFELDESKIDLACDEELEDEFDDFKEGCLKKVKEIKEKRKELEGLPTHEILEEGEKMGLWKLKERQKRLNISDKSIIEESKSDIETKSDEKINCPLCKSLMIIEDNRTNEIIYLCKKCNHRTAKLKKELKESEGERKQQTI